MNDTLRIEFLSKVRAYKNLVLAGNIPTHSSADPAISKLYRWMSHVIIDISHESLKPEYVKILDFEMPGLTKCDTTEDARNLIRLASVRGSKLNEEWLHSIAPIYIGNSMRADIDTISYTDEARFIVDNLPSIGGVSTYRPVSDIWEKALTDEEKSKWDLTNGRGLVKFLRHIYTVMYKAGYFHSIDVEVTSDGFDGHKITPKITTKFDKKSMSEIPSYVTRAIQVYGITSGEYNNNIFGGPKGQKDFLMALGINEDVSILRKLVSIYKLNVLSIFFGGNVQPGITGRLELLGDNYREICMRNPEYFTYPLGWKVEKRWTRGGKRVIFMDTKTHELFNGKNRSNEIVTKLASLKVNNIADLVKLLENTKCGPKLTLVKSGVFNAYEIQAILDTYTEYKRDNFTNYSLLYLKKSL